MRWYWVISCSNTVSKPFVSSAGDLHGHEDWEFDQGCVITKWNPQSWIQCTVPEWDGEPDDALQTHLAIPIFSPRLQRIIEESQFSGIQFLPIRVLRMNGDEISGFSVANILNQPFAMDMERSWYDRYDEESAPEDRGRVSGVYRMVLRRSALNGFDIIRVREFHQSFYVSERFKTAFENEQCTGYTFQEVQIS